MKLRLYIAILTCAALALVTFARMEAPRADDSRLFTGLGDLDGGIFHSTATDVSDDGEVVVGNSYSYGGMEAFRWTFRKGIIALNFLDASAISADSATVVGYRLRDGAATPVRWTTRGGIQDVNVSALYQVGAANDVSANGSTIIGVADENDGDRDIPFCWERQRGVESLPTPTTTLRTGEAHAVSADGLVIVGSIRRADGYDEAYRWAANSQSVSLGFLPAHCTSAARAVSADGSVVVGTSGDGVATRAFRWTRQTGMVSLGSLSQNGRDSTALGVSADGSVVVGCCDTEIGQEAFVWNRTHGMRSLRQILERDHNVTEMPRGWKLQSAQAISADGVVVVGFGMNPRGQREAWIARLTPQSK